MKIQEAINHAKETAERQRKDNDNCKYNEYGCKGCADYYSKPCNQCAEEHEQLAEWLEGLQQYKEIGTVEECRAAMEKQREKKPNKRADTHTDLMQYYYCPVCGRYFGQAGVHSVICFNTPKYCICGQAIDWSDEN